MDNITKVGQFYWGKLIDGNTPRGDFRILATSQELSVEQTDNFLSKIYLGSHERINLEKLTHAYSFAQVDPKHCIFAHVRPSRVADRGHRYPVYHGLVIPIEALKWLRLRQILESAGTETYAPDFSECNFALPPILIYEPQQANIGEAWNLKLKELRNHKHSKIEAIFNTILSNDYSILIDYTPNNELAIIDFVQALWDMLPKSHVCLVSFCTEFYDDMNTTFKIKGLHPRGYRKASNDLLLSFDTLLLESNPATQNWYSSIAVKWLTEARNQTEFSKKIQTLESDLKEITNQYPELTPTEQLNIVGALQAFSHQSDLQTINSELIVTLLGVHRLMPEKVQKKLSLKLFDLGFKTQHFDLWQTLLTNGLIDKFYNDLFKQLEITSDNTSLISALRYWLLVDTHPNSRILLSLISNLGQRFIEAVRIDNELMLHISEIYFNHQIYHELTFLLNRLTEETQIHNVLSHIVGLVGDQNQLISAFDLVKSATIPISLKKTFYLKLIDLSPQTTLEIGLELLKDTNKSILSDAEKLRILALNLPNQERNLLLLDLMNSQINNNIDSNNYNELQQLITVYQTKLNTTEAAHRLFINQAVNNFVILTSQVLSYFERINGFVDFWDTNLEDADALDEVRLMFSTLSEEEHRSLYQTLNALRQLLEYKGILARTVPTVTALNRIVEILNSV